MFPDAVPIGIDKCVCVVDGADAESVLASLDADNPYYVAPDEFLAARK
jgi:hypothetical protein